MENIISIIKDIGFPIACVIYMGFYIKKLTDEYRTDIKGVTEQYNEAIKDFRKTLERNTLVLTGIEKRLEKEDSEK